MNNLLRRSKLFVNRNASTILTSIGGVGVVTTVVLAVKATPKALQSIEEAKEEKGEDLTKMEIVCTAGPAYIPTAIAGVSTLACIFGANALNKRQQASLMSAYALANASYNEFVAKVNDIYGEEAAQQVIEAIAEDKFEESEVSAEEDDKLLIYDEFSKRYFKASMDDLIKAEHAINRELVTKCYSCMNELYEILDLPYIDGGDALGWSPWMMEEMTWSSWLDFHLHKAEMEDGTEYHILTLSCDPMPDYAEY